MHEKDAAYQVAELFGRRASQNAREVRTTQSKTRKQDTESEVSTAVGTTTTVSKDVPSSLASAGCLPAQKKGLAELADASLDGSLSTVGQKRLTAALQRLNLTLETPRQ
jgi:hypothetical protein